MKTPRPQLFIPLEDQLPEELPPDACLAPWQPGYLPLANYPGNDAEAQGSNSKVS